MTPQELKNSILQLAIQGKLVEQRPEEGSAEELFTRIQKEKQRLIAEKKIKKEKPLPEITDDEKPFDIPESWKWVRLDDISYQIGDIDHKMPPTVQSGGVPYISPLNFTKDGGIDFEGAKQIGMDDFLNLSKKCVPEKNDIIFPRYGTIGVIRMVDTDRKFLVSYSCCTIKNMKNLMDSQFVFYVLQTKLIKDEINRYINKTTQPNVGLKSIKMFLFPLPPLSEQRRIVAKIETLLPYVERYEQAWSKLEQFNSRFPEDMKKSLLQYAIQGKLVEQRPEEGTAEELFAQIQQEKQRLIAEKKTKKEKPLPEITDDEKPFDIPGSWIWVRLKDICSKITDGTHHSPPNSEEGVYKYITAKNIKDSGIDLTNISYVSQETHEEIYSRCNPEQGDILLIKDGATTGVATVNNLVEQFSMLSSVALLKKSAFVDAWYVVYALRSDLFYKIIRSQMKGTGITRITLKQIEPLVIPLPPLAEQKRIVEKLEQLLPLCEQLS